MEWQVSEVLAAGEECGIGILKIRQIIGMLDIDRVLSSADMVQLKEAAG